MGGRQLRNGRGCNKCRLQLRMVPKHIAKWVASPELSAQDLQCIQEFQGGGPPLVPIPLERLAEDLTEGGIQRGQALLVHKLLKPRVHQAHLGQHGAKVRSVEQAFSRGGLVEDDAQGEQV